MQVEILTRKGWIKDSVMPFMAKDLMTDQQADEFGFCRDCGLACYCHPMTPSEEQIPGCRTFTKLCTMVYFDICKPNFKLKDLI